VIEKQGEMSMKLQTEDGPSENKADLFVQN